MIISILKISQNGCHSYIVNMFDRFIPVPFLGHCLHGDPQAFPREQQHVDLR